MKMKVLSIAALSLGLAAGCAFAQSSTVTGAVGGAATGAVVGGPLGAAVGGVAGAIVGTAIDPPPQKVVTYVREQPVTEEGTVVRERVVVGRSLPDTVVVRTVPENPRYAYAVVNHERVIVEPSSRKVIQVLN
ncbi:MAG: DUF1236 domain-containing protein [Rhizobium sp.]|nr:MAG: DUF1236 domain-containing protein [Rhizobium sp.]